MVNPRDVAGNTDEEGWWTKELGMQKKKKIKGKHQRYSWERRRTMLNPRDIAGNTETEEEEWWTPEI